MASLCAASLWIYFLFWFKWLFMLLNCGHRVRIQWDNCAIITKLYATSTRIIDLLNFFLNRKLNTLSCVCPRPTESALICYLFNSRFPQCPVALTPMVMKCLERLVRDHVTPSLPVTIDPLQFAYQTNRSTDDAMSHLLHTLSGSPRATETLAEGIKSDIPLLTTGIFNTSLWWNTWRKRSSRFSVKPRRDDRRCWMISSTAEQRSK